MDLITDLPLVDGKNSLCVCINKFSKFDRLTPIFLGEGELSMKQTASLFFESIIRLFRVLSGVLHDRDVHFTA